MLIASVNCDDEASGDGRQACGARFGKSDRERMRLRASLNANIDAAIGACVPQHAKRLRERVNDRGVSMHGVVEVDFRRGELQPEGVLAVVGRIADHTDGAIEISEYRAEIAIGNEL